MNETTLLDIQFDYIFERLFGIEKNKKLQILFNERLDDLKLR